MNRLNFYIDWFYKEADRQTSLNESLNIPIGILTVVFGLLFFMFANFSFSLEENVTIEMLFLLFLVITSVLGVAVILYLFASYIGFFTGNGYKALPVPYKLNKQYKELEQYIEENKQLLDKNITADSIYEEQLMEMLSDYIDYNVETNDRKMSYLYRAKQLLFVCVISVMLCAIPFSIHFYSNKEKENVQKIEIHNLYEILNSKKQNIK